MLGPRQLFGVHNCQRVSQYAKQRHSVTIPWFISLGIRFSVTVTPFQGSECGQITARVRVDERVQWLMSVLRLTLCWKLTGKTRLILRRDRLSSVTAATEKH